MLLEEKKDYNYYIIIINFVRYVTFMFFNVYVLETVLLVNQNVW
jgi:hypothetical protein